MFMQWIVPVALDVSGMTGFLFRLTGLMPYNFICIQTGSILSKVTSVGEIITVDVMLRLAGMALVALLPGLLFRKYKRRIKSD